MASGGGEVAKRYQAHKDNLGTLADGLQRPGARLSRNGPDLTAAALVAVKNDSASTSTSPNKAPAPVPRRSRPKRSKSSDGIIINLGSSGRGGRKPIQRSKSSVSAKSSSLSATTESSAPAPILEEIHRSKTITAITVNRTSGSSTDAALSRSKTAPVVRKEDGKDCGIVKAPKNPKDKIKNKAKQKSKEENSGTKGETTPKKYGKMVENSELKQRNSLEDFEAANEEDASDEIAQKENKNKSKIPLKEEEKGSSSKEKKTASKDKGGKAAKKKESTDKKKKKRKKDKTKVYSLNQKLKTKNSKESNKSEDETSVASSIVNPRKSKVSAFEWDVIGSTDMEAQPLPLKKRQFAWFGFTGSGDSEDGSLSIESLDEGSFSSLDRETEESDMDNSLNVMDLMNNDHKSAASIAYSNSDDDDDDSSSSSSSSISSSSEEDSSSSSTSSSSESATDSSGSNSSARKRAAKDKKAAKKRASELKKLQKERKRQRKAIKKSREKENKRLSGPCDKRQYHLQHEIMNSSFQSSASNRGRRRREQSRRIEKLHSSVSGGGAGQLMQDRDFRMMHQSASNINPFGFDADRYGGMGGVPNYRGNSSEDHSGPTDFDRSQRSNSSRGKHISRGKSTDDSINRFGGRMDSRSNRRARGPIKRTMSNDETGTFNGRGGRRPDNNRRHNGGTDFNSSKSSFGGGSQHGLRTTSYTSNEFSNSRSNFGGGNRHEGPAVGENPIYDFNSSKSSLHAGSRHGRRSAGRGPFEDLNSSKHSLHGSLHQRTVVGARCDPFNTIDSSMSSVSNIGSFPISEGRRGRGRAGGRNNNIQDLNNSALQLTLQQSQDQLAFVENGKWMLEKEQEANAPPRVQAWEKRRNKAP